MSRPKGSKSQSANGIPHTPVPQTPPITEAKDWCPLPLPGEHAQIWKCRECGTERAYGRGMFIPETRIKGINDPSALLICHGAHGRKINQHFVHAFSGIWIGGALREKEMLNI